MPDEKVEARTHHEIKLARYAWNEAVACLRRDGDPDAERDLRWVKATAYRIIKLGDGSEFIYAPHRSPIRPWWINGTGLTNPKRVRDELPMTAEDFALVIGLMEKPLMEAP